MPFYVVASDIVCMETDAIVNAANCTLRPGGGVCGAIFRAAGYDALEKACRCIGRCDTGCAVITPGFALKAPWIIHTVGPVWHVGGCGEEELLRSAYRSSLALAAERGLTSIAFPLISAGIFGYPKAEALRIARESIVSFLTEHEMDVYLVLYDNEALSLCEECL